MEFFLQILTVLAIVVFAFIYMRPRGKATENDGLLLIQEQISKLTERLDERLDKTQLQMRDSISQQLGHSTKLIQDVTERLTKLDETNKRVVDVTAELKTLQNVLQNPKQRGVLGEYYLQTVLENVLPPDRFQLQYKLNNGDIVDAVIFLEDKLIPIDSKFSLENYNRLIEETDPTKREVIVKLFKQDLKNRIDETAKYISPDDNTMDFAFMFIPSEAIYYDLLVNKVGTVKTSARDLIEYAFRDKKVIIVSPTSFLAYLQTVLQGLRSLQIEKQTTQILKNVIKLGDHLQKYEDFHQKLGGSLATTVNHYNNAHKQFRLIEKDVVKINGGEPKIEALEIDKPHREG